MPNQRATTNNELSFRGAKRRGICFFFFLLAASTSALNAQVQRPKIIGIARVGIEGGSFPADAADKPVRFYSALRLDTLGAFQTGAPVHVMYALNEHQELDLNAGPRLAPPENAVSLILFETSDLAALHDYLKSKEVIVNDVTADSAQVKDFSGKSMRGDASIFYVQDPEGHTIGFVQYKLPLKYKPQEGQVSTRLIHAGFIVRDREKMEHFYKDILGFRPYWHGGMKDDETSWVSLQVPDGTDWIEFMLYDPTGKDKHFLGVMNHIALGVTDIQAAKAQLLKNGVKLTEEPKLGRDGKWQLNVYDPDETRVEFMEFTPKEKPCCSDFTGPHPKP